MHADERKCDGRPGIPDSRSFAFICGYFFGSLNNSRNAWLPTNVCSPEQFTSVSGIQRCGNWQVSSFYIGMHP